MNCGRIHSEYSYCKTSDPVLMEEKLLEQMTIETFEQVVNQPATREELRAVEIVDAVVKNKNSDLILKSIINRMLSQDWEGTQSVINDAVFHHPKTGKETTLLDINWYE